MASIPHFLNNDVIEVVVYFYFVMILGPYGRQNELRECLDD